MAYLLYSLVLLTLVFGTALYIARAHWLPALQDAIASLPVPTLYSRLPGGFAGDIDAGLSSSNFDLNANLESGDGRAGLDAAAKAEVLRIMKKRRLKFDDARRVYMEQRFSANGIAADGRPRDPKFVSFS